MIEKLSDEALLDATRALLKRACDVEADLLLHLGEIDERKLYLPRAHPSMFAFCVEELGFSEDAAYNRIFVARAARRLPALIEALRSGKVHLGGLRLLAPLLTVENHLEVLARAAGKSKRRIEEIVVRMAPRPPVAPAIRKLPEQAALPVAAAARVEHRPIVRPLSEETYRVQFTASRALRDKLKHAQDLLRHKVGDGDLAEIVERGLDLLIEKVEKERFAVGRKPKKAIEDCIGTSRNVPDPIRRLVYERDGGRCAFVDGQGRRCPATGGLELDHLDGWARTHQHSPDRMRLLCAGHNQHAADQLYGRPFMDRARATCPGTSGVDQRHESGAE